MIDLKLNVLGRLSKTLDVKAKFMLFNSFVLSNFNCCPVVWHYCNITNLRKIENIQKGFSAVDTKLELYYMYMCVYI